MEIFNNYYLLVYYLLPYYIFVISGKELQIVHIKEMDYCTNINLQSYLMLLSSFGSEIIAMQVSIEESESPSKMFRLMLILLD